jgi:hypothetical protein
MLSGAGEHVDLVQDKLEELTVLVGNGSSVELLSFASCASDCERSVTKLRYKVNVQYVEQANNQHNIWWSHKGNVLPTPTTLN